MLSDIASQVKDNLPLLRHLPSLYTRQSLASENASAISLCAAVLSQESGGYYIMGGIPHLERASIATIRRAGGRAVLDVDVMQLAIDDKNRCEGVVLSNGTIIRAKCGVISGLGAICTFTRMLSSKNAAVCQPLLRNIEEQRPKIKVVAVVSGPVMLGADTMIVQRNAIDEEKAVHGNTLWVWSPTVKSNPTLKKYVYMRMQVFTCVDPNI